MNDLTHTNAEELRRALVHILDQAQQARDALSEGDADEADKVLAELLEDGSAELALPTDPATAAAPILAAVVAEFCADVETVGVDAVAADWPDLIETYRKAIEAQPGTAKRRRQRLTCLHCGSADALAADIPATNPERTQDHERTTNPSH